MLRYIVLLGLAAMSLPAQTTFATITGTVTDATGAAVPGAAITAIHKQSNYSYKGASNEAGAYTVAQLLQGTYTVRVQAGGFKEAVVQNVELVSLDVRRIDVKLEVGAVETSIEVSEGAALIETETARISDSKGAQQLKVLPLNTRSLWNFIGLTPGVTQAGAGSSTRRFSGSRANQSDASIDGITLSNQYDGTQISPLVSQIESFEEVRVDMANNTAEFGGIGQVTIVSKGGGNELHGSGFDYYASPWFRARNPFALTRASGVRHNPGAAIGGPVYIPKVYDGRNKTFFFYSFETTRGSLIQNLLNPTVAPAPWRSGDFSREPAVRDPFANNTPFPGNQIPANRISAVSRRIQDRFFPLPNTGDPNVLTNQNFRVQLQRPFDPNTYWTTRIDHRFTQKHFVFGRYTWNRSHSRDYEGNLPAIGQRWQTRDTRAVNLSYTSTLKTNLINEFRWGFAWNDNPRNGALLGNEVVKDLGITGLFPNLPDINGLLKVNWANIGLTGITQTDWRHPGFLNYAQQFQEHLSWFRGRHNIKVGVIAGRTLYQDSQAPAALFGTVNFSNRFTGHAYGDFLLGIPTSAQRAAPQVFIERLRWNWDFFATDEFKVRNNLTLNLGLRYESHPAWNETSGRQSVFDVGTGRIVVPDGSLSLISPLMPRGYVDVVEASQAGYPKNLLKTDRNNFAPRVGLAWRPFGPNTVVRAGFGVFYDIVPRQVNAGGAPYVIAEPTFTNPTPIPTLQFPQVFPGSVAGPTTVGLPGATRVDLRDPFSMQYNLTVEHQRWNTGFRASYIGTNTRQGQWAYNYNQPVPDARAFVDKPRPFPRYPAIAYSTNGAGHQYNSLTLEAERRFASGLGYQLSWVWARDIGDLERGQQPENAFDRERERSVWLDIPTHRVTGNLIYELPFGRGKKFLSSSSRVVRALTDGWDLSVIYSSYSGQFLTPTWTGPDPTGTAFTGSRTPAQVTLRPNILRDPNLAANEQSTGRWFDLSAFSGLTVPGQFGTSAKGVVIGPGVQVVNSGLGKQFYLTERIRMRWELTATNTFNTPNYANPNMSITAGVNSGRITGIGGDVSPLDATGSRNLRMGLRVEF